MGYVAEGAESWSAEGGSHGALLLHGFVGNPVSLRPLAEALAAAGYAVELPRLPGHGTNTRECNRTRWPDWAREADAALDRLAARTERRIVVGLSMGGLLAFHLAGTRPELVEGVVAINPFLRAAAADPRVRALPVVKWIVPELAIGIGDDIAKADTTERPYRRTPLRALHSLVGLQKHVDLGAVTQPLLVLTSRQDRTINPADSEVALARVASVHREHHWLELSRHVATLDHDADVVIAQVTDFAKRVLHG